MLVADLVTILAETLKLLSKYDVKVDDYRFVDLYFDYERRRKDKEKYICVVDELSRKHNVSPSTIERLIRKFRKSVNPLWTENTELFAPHR